jgi:hypothetical protein
MMNFSRFYFELSLTGCIKPPTCTCYKCSMNVEYNSHGMNLTYSELLCLSFVTLVSSTVGRYEEGVYDTSKSTFAILLSSI